MKYRVAADIGGTFTDFVIEDTENKKTLTSKVLSNPSNASIAVLYKPTSVPNGPEIKCSSSCIINSGGGSDVFMLITFHSGFV